MPWMGKILKPNQNMILNESVHYGKNDRNYSFNEGKTIFY